MKAGDGRRAGSQMRGFEVDRSVDEETRSLRIGCLSTTRGPVGVRRGLLYSATGPIVWCRVLSTRNRRLVNRVSLLVDEISERHLDGQNNGCRGFGGWREEKG